MTDSQPLLRRIQQQQAELASVATVAADDKLDANPWLTRTSWACHLDGMEWDRMVTLLQPPQKEEITLQIIAEVVKTVMRKAQAYLLGPSCLFFHRVELNRQRADQGPTKPFVARLEAQTLDRYIAVWQRATGYVYRTFRDDERRYQLLPAQQAPWQTFVQLAENIPADEIEAMLHPPAEVPGNGVDDKQTPPPLTTLERAGLQAWIAWLDDNISSGEYANPLVSAMAILGYDVEQQTWMSPLNYTPKLAAIVKLGRMLIALHAVDQHREQLHQVQASIQDQVQRFGSTQKPSPMYWCIMLMTYGKAIRNTSTAGGTVRWDGEVVTHGRTRLDLHDFRAGIHSLQDRCRQQLWTKLLAVTAATDVPAIPWAHLEDFPAEQQTGYSFIQDPRTPWPVAGETWLFQRLVCEDNPVGLLRRRVDGVQPLADRGWDHQRVRQYMQAIIRFKEQLWVLAHLTSGQPARGSEVLSIRWRNTPAGGARNVFLEQRQVALVTAYHKGYHAQNSVKIVHRYLPQEVGELLIWYLWLVEPFHRQLEVAVYGRSWDTGFLWAEGAEDRLWHDYRVRTIMERETAIGMGVKLNVRIYRQLAVAIGRRYLQHQPATDDADSSDDEDQPADDVFDLQAGHSSRIAGTMYARGLTEAMGQVEWQRQVFRQASQAWHQFLQFPSAMTATAAKRKRGPDQSEADLPPAKRRQPTDIHTALRQLIGPEARFRGIQQEAIAAIQAGVSPIVAVMGTGGGKSLLFMLPALCAASASSELLHVTVVIVPMISLRADLAHRCHAVGLICMEWERQPHHMHTSIMLVTPESAVTTGFQTYLNRLKAQQLLDRIVVDECHVVLDSSEQFRPKLLQLPQLWLLECPIVMLTATLPPAEEVEFYRRMQLPPTLVTTFRASTVRPNVQYSVRPAARTAAQQQDQVVDVVQQCQDRYPDGKIFVYCMSVRQVEQLAARLNCPAYHRHVDGKADAFAAIMGPGGAVAVATNALGLGVDLPNIRAVIHVDGFRSLRDFGQESGRAGRDGLASESIVIGPVRPPADPAVAIWMAGQQCCRQIMDQYLDGDPTRIACQADEEACWVCRPLDPSMASSPSIASNLSIASSLSIASRLSIASSPSITSSSSVASRSVIASSAVIAKSLPPDQGLRISTPTTLRQHVQQRIRTEAAEVAGFTKAMQAWIGICPLCRISGYDNEHLLADCSRPEPIVQSVQNNVSQMLQCIRYAPYSACYDCGQPQWTCLRFISDGNGGWIRQAEDLCEGHGVIVGVIITAISAMPAWGASFIQRMEQEQVDTTSATAVGQWLGQKIRWSHHEAARIHQIFHEFTEFWVQQQGERWEL